MRASLSVVLVAALLTACQAAPPPLAFEHSSRAGVKHVWVLAPGIPEHAEVSILNPIGAGFGVIGSLIETRRTAAANAEMADVLSKAHYNFGACLTDAITVATRRAGFAVSRSEEPRPPKERERFLAQYPKHGSADAYLDVYAPYVGFWTKQSSVAYRARIEIVARLIDSRGAILFQRRIVYGSPAAEDEDALVIPGDDNAAFRDRDALQQNPSKTARALQTAIDSVAWELARQLM